MSDRSKVSLISTALQRWTATVNRWNKKAVSVGLAVDSDSRRPSYCLFNALHSSIGQNI